MCITKLDILDGLDSVSICTDYENPDSDSPTPVYRQVPGWSETTAEVRKLEDLPYNARAYLNQIEEACEIPIDVISTGPDRTDTILLKSLFD